MKRRCGSTLLSKASGSTSSKAVPSSTPTDRLTKWRTNRPSKARVSDAAISTDSKPPANVDSTM